MGQDMSASPLGFGLMRLPRRGFGIDLEQTKRMVDLFLDAGFTYFDTAHVYTGSEEAAKKALVERHPRQSYTLATKLYAPSALTEKAAKEQFYTSLKRTGAEYFDYYLLHSLMDGNVTKYERFHLWDFAQEQKARGLIRHVGFSFHAGPQLLDQLLREHPEAEFVQLQLNYADWENPKIAARANYEVARKHGKPIVVMEPIKGGSLAAPPRSVQKLFQGAAPGASFASWAVRFAASLPGVLSVLSGMSDLDQMRDNLSYMRAFQPLSAEELRVIQQAQRLMGSSATVPCTACRYCVESCPKQIPIPDIFTALNERLGSGQISQAEQRYAGAVRGRGRAEDCILCRRCENLCPQHIHITDHLKKAAELFPGV